ncbi:Hypothetical_protein [Hexamita inflata]|uniref:Hypothetical_protein n=1 Tax=Hexamita inflata TaxID=28002 RepID=A0AA86Q4W4_9EUKA|nr:Hypothetical protein HINF_LOCUS38231 [Hexamita inflata]CAI9959554.1 Hypothetical protein HINF_LOCUS47199 [Hexamita inflata]
MQTVRVLREKKQMRQLGSHLAELRIPEHQGDMDMQITKRYHVFDLYQLLCRFNLDMKHNFGYIFLFNRILRHQDIFQLFMFLVLYKYSCFIMSVHCYNGVKEPHDKQPKIWTLQYLLLHWAQHVFQVKEVSDSQVATRPNYIFWNTKKTQASKQPAILKSLIRSKSLSLTQNN